MFKRMVRKPIRTVKTYLKYGYVVTEYEQYQCPRCKKALNAGPQYQPKYCSECGQKISFRDIRWKEDVTLGYVRPEEGRNEYASVED